MSKVLTGTQVLASLFGFIIITTAVILPIARPLSPSPQIFFDEAEVIRDY